MKKIFLILLLLITINLHAGNNEINLHLNMLQNPGYGYTTSKIYNGLGLGLCLAGSAFTIGGLLSSTEQYGLTSQDKKFFDNPLRATVIINGGIILGTGIIISIK